MGGGLMQLVAYGAQDIYLTGNPQITFFKVVYRRHTNFACEAIEQTFNGTAGFGNKVVCTISRNGDLVSNMYLEIDLENGTPLNGSVRNGHKLIKSAEIEIGGQQIDKHYGEWLDIWTQLSSNDETLTKKDNMLSGNLFSSDSNRKLYVPLQFWFNRNPGLALPLIALQYHEVKISIEFNKLKDIKSSTINGIRKGLEIDGVDKCKFANLCLYCDYIFLDTDERRRFAQVSHEYLIEQVQTLGTSSTSSSKSTISLDLNHPIKEVVWVVQNEAAHGTFDYSLGIDKNRSLNHALPSVSSAKIQLNGQDRFRERDGSYFRVVQPYQHHTGGHRQQLNLENLDFNKINKSLDKQIEDHNDNLLSKEYGHIHCYSFALRPEEHQPSGTCNFSRIDNAILTMNLLKNPNNNKIVNVDDDTKKDDDGDRDLNVEVNDKEWSNVLTKLTSTVVAEPETENTTNKNIRVYATNYNVLRIMSGMGGLAYSN
jgi:hypothetical protein